MEAGQVFNKEQYLLVEIGNRYYEYYVIMGNKIVGILHLEDISWFYKGFNEILDDSQVREYITSLLKATNRIVCLEEGEENLSFGIKQLCNRDVELEKYAGELKDSLIHGLLIVISMYEDRLRIN